MCFVESFFVRVLLIEVVPMRLLNLQVTSSARYVPLRSTWAQFYGREQGKSDLMIFTLRLKYVSAKAVTNKAPICPHRTPKYPDVTKIMQCGCIHENGE